MEKIYLNQIQSVLNEMVEKEGASGGNCLVYKDGSEYGYYEAGFKDLENRIKIQRDTIFRLYSMSKPMTAAAAMLLIQEGKLDLLSPVSEYIPSFGNPIVWEDKGNRAAKRSVNIQDLLNMTSGYSYEGTENKTQILTGELIEEIKEKMNGDQALSTLEIAEKLGNIPLSFDPGKQFLYGMSADILGAVIEIISEERFGTFLKKRFFEPLEMKDTDFYVPETKQERLAKVYRATSKGLELYELSHLGISNSMKKPAAFESGGAGLVSTIDDWSNFCKMLLSHGSFKERQIFTPQMIKFYSGSIITEEQRMGMKDWDNLSGYSYGNLMRILIEPQKAVTLGEEGEYGWDGWLGTYMSIVPSKNMFMILMKQLTDAGTTTYTRRIRNIIFSQV